ncbi:MAG TPA: endonuclease/exonuclease/phosphatase family protein [Vicinamibacterales bacterium]
MREQIPGLFASSLAAGIAGLLSINLLASAPAGGTAAQPNAPDRELRVMTYNIKHGQTNAPCTPPPPQVPPLPDCNLDLQASIDVIRAHAPDIVGIQEVDRFWARSGSVDEPALIAAGLGMPHYCYAPNLDHGPDNHANVPHQYGTVIVSRFPILECRNQLLPRAGNTEQRGLTLARINVRGVPLQFYNTHLHTAAADRLLQTAAIAETIDNAPAGSKVLMGDFNAGPTTAEMVPIFARFVDAWTAAGVPTPENPEGLTSPSLLEGPPRNRIDYVLVSPQVTVSQVYVPIDAQTRLAADHYPVVADIALPGSEVGIGRN